MFYSEEYNVSFTCRVLIVLLLLLLLLDVASSYDQKHNIYALFHGSFYQPLKFLS
jgi:hypothetical protein